MKTPSSGSGSDSPRHLQDPKTEISLALVEEAQRSVDDIVSETASKDDLEKVDRQAKRGRRMFLLIILITILGGYIFTYVVSRQQGAAAARIELLEGSTEVLRQANEQRAQQGLPPIQAPVTDVLNTSGIIANVTNSVLAQISTDPNFRGPKGEASLVPGMPGADSIVPGPEGKQGIQGEPGTQGQKGDAGPTCTPGSHVEQVTYLSGQSGPACVND